MRLGFLLLVLAAAGCGGPEAVPTRYDTYGNAVGSEDAIPVEQVLADPGAYAGRPIVISGPIADTCSRKGCWLQLGSADANVHVRFQDYGFFVPTDGVEGRNALAAGRLRVERQSVEERRHYLEDAGRHEEAARVREPLEVVSFTATGVAIERPPLAKQP
jgi:hypothetical protein